MNLTDRLVRIPGRRKAVAAALLLAAALAGGHLAARAVDSTLRAHFGGIDVSRRTQPVLTVFNAQDVTDPVDIDVTLRDTEGNVIRELPDALSLGPFESGSVDLWAALREGLARRERPYTGLLAVEVGSGSPDFRMDGLVLHVTEFFSNPKRPRAAILFRPLWVDQAP